jgi:hypothetical protein
VATGAAVAGTAAVGALAVVLRARGALVAGALAAVAGVAGVLLAVVLRARGALAAVVLVALTALVAVAFTALVAGALGVDALVAGALRAVDAALAVAVRPGPVAAAADFRVDGTAAATSALAVEAARRRGVFTAEPSDLATFLATLGVDAWVVSSTLALGAVVWTEAMAFWAARLVEYAPLDDSTRPWDIRRNRN